ncbi:GNAT family N-acetyltransferase [Candidatus Saccharibacteria bacterium]|nr:GNAT family N-acetyltransferase [Candidatus Saccharibacteria bacterium]
MKKQPRSLADVTIRSERLILRPITLDDARDVFIEFNDNVTKMMAHGPNESLEATSEFIEKTIQQTREGEKLQFVIVDKEEKFLGLASIEDANHRTPEIGLWLKKAAQGKGFGTELVFALVEWANQNLEFDYIKYRVHAQNVGSWKIAEKLIEKYGGEFIGETPEILQGVERMTKVYHIFPENS